MYASDRVAPYAAAGSVVDRQPAAPVEAEAKSEPERPAGACGQRIADYLAAREQLSRCETDSDCAEMWPGLCPHGPYYIHRDAEIEPVLALEREIMATPGPYWFVGMAGTDGEPGRVTRHGVGWQHMCEG